MIYLSGLRKDTQYISDKRYKDHHDSGNNTVTVAMHSFLVSSNNYHCERHKLGIYTTNLL